MSIKAMVIDTDDIARMVVLDAGARPLQQLVGGYLEAAPCEDAALTFWCHDEGKVRGWPANRLATMIWHHTTPMMRGHDLLVGTVVITGGFDHNGATLGLPDDWGQRLGFDEELVDAMEATAR